MSANEKILIEILFKCIDIVNGTLNSNNKIRKDLDEILTGPNSSIESITLVNLLLELEIQVESIGMHCDVFAILDNHSSENLKLSHLLDSLSSAA